MQGARTIRAIRESLQVILSEALITPRQVAEVKKIDRLLTRLEAQLLQDKDA